LQRSARLGPWQGKRALSTVKTDRRIGDDAPALRGDFYDLLGEIAQTQVEVSLM